MCCQISSDLSRHELHTNSGPRKVSCRIRYQDFSTRFFFLIPVRCKVMLHAWICFGIFFLLVFPIYPADIWLNSDLEVHEPSHHLELFVILLSNRTWTNSRTRYFFLVSVSSGTCQQRICVMHKLQQFYTQIMHAIFSPSKQTNTQTSCPYDVKESSIH